MSDKPVGEWTRAEFEALPNRKWNEDVGLLDEIVIIPAEPPNHLHDSGYRRLVIVGCIGGIPRFTLSECSDVVHIEGINGQGRYIPGADFDTGHWPGPEGRRWRIDCLPVSGFLRLLVTDRIEVGSALSSFEVYSRKKEAKR
jgi:hypothetical protein